MSVPLLNSLLLKDEFIQRFGVTSEPPIVAAATVPKFLEILDPPFDFVCPTLLHVGLFEFVSLLFEFSFWSVHILDCKALLVVCCFICGV